jgi:hypothetical protein
MRFLYSLLLLLVVACSGNSGPPSRIEIARQGPCLDIGGSVEDLRYYWGGQCPRSDQKMEVQRVSVNGAFASVDEGTFICRCIRGSNDGGR